MIGWKSTILFMFLLPYLVFSLVTPDNFDNNQNSIPFEAVFQGLCEENELCEQLCFNLHDGTFECDCQPDYTLDSNGYSCSKRNVTSQTESSILYKKEASFVAVLDDNDYQGDDPSSASDELFGSQFEKYSPSNNLLGKKSAIGISPFINREELNRDINDYQRNDNYLHEDEDNEKNLATNLETDDEDDESYSSGDYAYEDKDKIPLTSQGPNLEQKVPSEVPNLEATESLTPTCQLDCGAGKCITEKPLGVERCQCPIGKSGVSCKTSSSKIEFGRFRGNSWAAFAPLREAYRDVQLTLEFKPRSNEGVLLVSGENDDLSGDFMAAALINGFVHFKWDCGSGAGSVQSPDKVKLNEWNRITVYRHRWDVWFQLNNGHHVQGRSEGLFSRITFREPLYVGGTYNLTSLLNRLGVRSGFDGCIKKLQVNNHVYKFFKQDPLDKDSIELDYAATDGWDITECTGELCSEIDCQNGGKCVTSTSSKNLSLLFSPSSNFVEESSSGAPVCVCPLGYDGNFCERALNLEVPSFNGSSILVFPPLRNSVISWLEMEIIFRPTSTEGVVLYAGHRADGTGDFFAITLSQAHVLVTIDLGSGPLTLRSLYPVSPNLWHTVRISRTGRRTWFYVNDQLPVEGLTPGAFTMLSLSQPMFLGGLPSSNFPPPILPETSNFVGCIQKLTLSDQPIHLISGATSGVNVGACDHPCSIHPCDNGGLCEPLEDSYFCRCPIGYNDPHCRSLVVTQVATPSFSGRSFLKFSEPDIWKRLSGDKLHLWFRFRSTAPDGLLLWIGSEELSQGILRNLASPPLGDFLSLELKAGRVVLSYNLGSGFAELSYNATGDICQGEWHTLKLTRFEKTSHLTIDEGPLQEATSPGDLVQLNVDSPLYIGGTETYKTTRGDSQSPGLKGCIADLILATDYHVDLMNQAEAGQNIDYC